MYTHPKSNVINSPLAIFLDEARPWGNELRIPLATIGSNESPSAPYFLWRYDISAEMSNSLIPSFISVIILENTLSVIETALEIKASSFSSFREAIFSTISSVGFQWILGRVFGSSRYMEYEMWFFSKPTILLLWRIFSFAAFAMRFFFSINVLSATTSVLICSV